MQYGKLTIILNIVINKKNIKNYDQKLMTILLDIFFSSNVRIQHFLDQKLHFKEPVTVVRTSIWTTFVLILPGLGSRSEPGVFGSFEPEPLGQKLGAGEDKKHKRIVL